MTCSLHHALEETLGSSSALGADRGSRMSRLSQEALFASVTGSPSGARVNKREA
jgi:hypothetical protein